MSPDQHDDDVIDLRTPEETLLIRAERAAAAGLVLAVAGLLGAGWWTAGHLSVPLVWAVLGLVLAASSATAGVLWRSYRQDAEWLADVLEGDGRARLITVWLAASVLAPALALVLSAAVARLLWDSPVPGWAIILAGAPFAGAAVRLWPEHRRVVAPVQRWHGIALRRLEEVAETEATEVDALERGPGLPATQ